MSAKSVSLSSMFGWVTDSFALFKKAPATMLGASALMLVLAIAMALPLLGYMFTNMAHGMANGMAGANPYGANTTLFFGFYGLTILLNLAFGPPLVVGWYRLCRALDQGQAVGASEVLKPFQDPELWFRSLRTALLAIALYVLVAGLFAAAFWSTFVDFTQRIAEQQAAAMAGTAPAHPGLPLGFFAAYFCFLGVILVLQFVYMLSFAEVGLRPTGALAAMRMALSGVGRNLWKLVVFTFLLTMLAAVVLTCVILALVLVCWVLSLIHWLLAVLVGVLFYALLLLCLYPLMFAGNYYAWKSVLGGDGAATGTASDSTLTA